MATSEDTASLGASDTVKPRIFDKVKPSASDTVKPGASKPIKPGIFDTAKPGASDTVKHGASDTGMLGASKTTKPGIFDAVKPEASDTGMLEDYDTGMFGDYDTGKLGDDKVMHGHLIATIAEQTGLPKHQEASDLHQPLGRMLGATLHKPEMDRMYQPHERIPISPLIVQNVSLLSVAPLLGQGILLETQSSEIAFVSIAEASYVQLGDLCGLLECVLMVLEHSLSLGEDAVAD